MAEFAPAIAGVLADEGGLIEDPRDPGGLTKFGISQRSYPEVNIRDLTREEAETIYERDFWKFAPLKSQRLANKMLDIYVNLPPANAIRLLQTSVDRVMNDLRWGPIDGILGPATINYANKVDEDALIDELKAQLVLYYLADVRNDDSKFPFLTGWIRRAVKG